MKTFSQKHKDLEKQVAIKFNKLVKSKGTKSKHINELTLRVKEDQQFDLDGGRYLTEITSNDRNTLLDNNGYSYQLSCLTLEQLCEIADSFR